MEVIYKLRSTATGYTDICQSDFERIKKIIDGYDIKYSDIIEYVSRIKAMDDLYTNYINAISDITESDLDKDRIVLGQECESNNMTIYYKFEYDHQAGNINPNNLISRKLSIVFSSYISNTSGKYEITFCEKDSAGRKFANVTSSRIHSKELFDYITTWLLDSLRVNDSSMDFNRGLVIEEV